MTFIERGNYWRAHEEDRQQHSFKQSAPSDILGFPCNFIIRKLAETTKFRPWLSLSLCNVPETVKLFLSISTGTGRRIGGEEVIRPSLLISAQVEESGLLHAPIALIQKIERWEWVLNQFERVGKETNYQTRKTITVLSQDPLRYFYGG